MLTNAQILGLDESALSENTEGHKLLSQVHSRFSRMQAQAANDGIDIQLASSYRNFARQLLIWNDKWLGKRPLYRLDGTLLETAALSDQQKLDAILTWSALPGASRHHWGTDMDVYDKTSVQRRQAKFELVGAEYEAGGSCYNLNCWLAEYAADFGFARPYNTYVGGVAPEPWHLSFQPIANEIQVDLDALRAQLTLTDLAGKTIVMDNLEYIYNCYTLNLGTSKTEEEKP